MKYWYILVLSLLGVLGFAQSEIKVFKAGNRTPIAGASVACNGKILGRTNAAGILKFRTQCRSVEVAAKGYYETEVVVDKVMEATLEQLEKGTASIEKVVLKDVSDPKALELLKKVRAHYSDNTPQSLPSYSFKAYEKTALDLDQDTIQQYNDFVKARLDSLKQLPQKNQDQKKIKDSIENIHTMKLVGQSKAFLWERVKEFAYSKKYGEKITVLDNRVSGLNNPIYEMLTLRSNRTKMPREILEENQKLYRYFLTDTLDVEGRPSYVIRFRQTNYKQRENRRKYNGYLYIDAATYGLKKIESNSYKKNEGSFTSIWTLVEGKWFLQKENLKLKAGQISFKQNKEEKNKGNKKQQYGYYVYHIADYFDYQTNFEAKAKDFKGYTMEIKNADGSLLSQYRTDSLSQRDLMTYTKIDSVGQKYQLDRKVKLVLALLGGKLRAGKVDFNLGNAIKYTLYEGLRLEAEVKMNDKFHRYLSPDAYIAYGFKDRGLKYGLGLDIKTILRKTSFFRIEYYHDVLAAGKFSERLWSFKMKIMNGGVNLKNDRFYQYEGVKLSYENDLLNSLTLRTSVARNVEQALFDYDYHGLRNQFDNFKTIVTLKYTPKSKNIMTPSGKYTFERGFPEFYFNFEKAGKALGGDFDYTKMDILATHRFKTKAGITGARVYSGIVTGEAPIWHLFHMNGLSGHSSNFNYNLTSYLGFATMQAGKYYNDRMLGYYLTHRLPWHFKSFGQQTSSFDLVYRGAIGDMKHPERHQVEFSTLNRLYQEAGFEWNNFLSTGLNLGFFYLVGHYQTPKFEDNFAVQLKVKLLGF